MIERGEVDGRMATIAYFTKDFKPCEKFEADFAKVFFDKMTDDGIMQIILSMKNQVGSR